MVAREKGVRIVTLLPDGAGVNLTAVMRICYVHVKQFSMFGTSTSNEKWVNRPTL